jgi:hypothetical protein
MPQQGGWQFLCISLSISCLRIFPPGTQIIFSQDLNIRRLQKQADSGRCIEQMTEWSRLLIRDFHSNPKPLPTPQIYLQPGNNQSTEILQQNEWNLWA